MHATLRSAAPAKRVHFAPLVQSRSLASSQRCELRARCSWLPRHEVNTTAAARITAVPFQTIAFWLPRQRCAHTDDDVGCHAARSVCVKAVVGDQSPLEPSLPGIAHSLAGIESATKAKAAAIAHSPFPLVRSYNKALSSALSAFFEIFAESLL